MNNDQPSKYGIPQPPPPPENITETHGSYTFFFGTIIFFILLFSLVAIRIFV